MSDSDSPFSSAIPDADYFEHKPEFQVGSWSPAPPGTKHAPTTQVHLRIGTPPGNVALVRIKNASTCDELIKALIEHRTFTWGAPTDHRVWLPTKGTR